MRLEDIARNLTRKIGFSGGPEQAFDAVGRHTFITLLRHGLLPESRVLDYGCGSLRLGYWIMRFLDEGNYYGIEPSDTHLLAGKEIVIGEKLLAEKVPVFSDREDFTLDVFDTRFDYVVARSIFTHFNPGAIELVLESVRDTLEPDGAFLASYWEPGIIGEIVSDGEPLAGDTPSAGLNVAYSKGFMLEMAERLGLKARRLDMVVNEQPWIKYTL